MLWDVLSNVVVVDTVGDEGFVLIFMFLIENLCWFSSMYCMMVGPNIMLTIINIILGEDCMIISNDDGIKKNLIICYNISM